MTRNKMIVLTLTFAAAVAMTACSSPTPQAPAAAPAASTAPAQAYPRFEVDATWPKPYPNKWKIGGVTGLARGGHP